MLLLAAALAAIRVDTARCQHVDVVLAANAFDNAGVGAAAWAIAPTGAQGAGAPRSTCIGVYGSSHSVELAAGSTHSMHIAASSATASGEHSVIASTRYARFAAFDAYAPRPGSPRLRSLLDAADARVLGVTLRLWLQSGTAATAAAPPSAAAAAAADACAADKAVLWQLRPGGASAALVSSDNAAQLGIWSRDAYELREYGGDLWGVTERTWRDALRTALGTAAPDAVRLLVSAQFAAMPVCNAQIACVSATLRISSPQQPVATVPLPTVATVPTTTTTTTTTAAAAAAATTTTTAFVTQSVATTAETTTPAPMQTPPPATASAGFAMTLSTASTTSILPKVQLDNARTTKAATGAILLFSSTTATPEVATSTAVQARGGTTTATTSIQTGARLEPTGAQRSTIVAAQAHQNDAVLIVACLAVLGVCAAGIACLLGAHHKRLRACIQRSARHDTEEPWPPRRGGQPRGGGSGGGGDALLLRNVPWRERGGNDKTQVIARPRRAAPVLVEYRDDNDGEDCDGAADQRLEAVPVLFAPGHAPLPASIASGCAANPESDSLGAAARMHAEIDRRMELRRLQLARLRKVD